MAKKLHNAGGLSQEIKDKVREIVDTAKRGGEGGSTGADRAEKRRREAEKRRREAEARRREAQRRAAERQAKERRNRGRGKKDDRDGPKFGRADQTTAETKKPPSADYKLSVSPTVTSTQEAEYTGPTIGPATGPDTAGYGYTVGNPADLPDRPDGKDTRTRWTGPASKEDEFSITDWDDPDAKAERERQRQIDQMENQVYNQGGPQPWDVDAPWTQEGYDPYLPTRMKGGVNQPWDDPLYTPATPGGMAPPGGSQAPYLPTILKNPPATDGFFGEDGGFFANASVPGSPSAAVPDNPYLPTIFKGQDAARNFPSTGQDYTAPGRRFQQNQYGSALGAGPEPPLPPDQQAQADRYQGIADVYEEQGDIPNDWTDVPPNGPATKAHNIPWSSLGFEEHGMGEAWANDYRETYGIWPWQGEGTEEENLGRALASYYGYGQDEEVMMPEEELPFEEEYYPLPEEEEYLWAGGGGGGFPMFFGGGGGGGYTPQLPPWMYTNMQRGI